MAIKAPARPSKVLKAKNASSETNGLTPTVLCITRGASTLFSICWMISVPMMTHTSRSGPSDKATIAAGMAPSSGPISGTASSTNAISANTRAFGKPISR